MFGSSPSWALPVPKGKERRSSLGSFTSSDLSFLAPIPNDIVRANQSDRTMAAMSALETITPKTVALVGLTLLVAAWVVRVRLIPNCVRPDSCVLTVDRLC